MVALLDTWNINCRLNLYLLDAVTDDQFKMKLEKGKTVVGNFTHLHNVRLMWIKAAMPEALAGLEKLDETATREQLVDALGKSAAAMAQVIASAGSPEGRVKGFKPHAAGFVGYLVAHETFHRTCVELALRQNGQPLSDKVAYGLWEWGVR
jgi:uncharacterized damage-inducible protein DinB